jgi:hypothetical protein
MIEIYIPYSLQSLVEMHFPTYFVYASTNSVRKECSNAEMLQIYEKYRRKVSYHNW